MKKYLFFAVVTMLMSSCKQADLDKSKSQNDSLREVLAQRDTSVYQFISAFDEVERNLDSVAIKQQIIRSSSDKIHGDLKLNKKARINSEIQAINYLMDKNRREIEDLKKKWNGSKNKNSQLAKTIATLEDQLLQKNNELNELNLKLESLNTEVAKLQTSVDTLSAENTVKSNSLDEVTKAYHTSYYVIGTTKELKDARIIDRKGGLLGIGKTSKLSKDFDNSKFTRIDYLETNSIPINSNSINIITSHPTTSYKLDKDDKGKIKNLVVTNSSSFWSASKYLVIVKK